MSIDEKDEIQYKKAQIKIGAVNATIPSLIELNNELIPSERKAYTILLDYQNFGDYYKFIVDIKRTYGFDNNSLLKIVYSLKDKKAGLNLLKQACECYAENSEMDYISFTSRNDAIVSFNMVGSNKVDLNFAIHDEEIVEELKELQNKFYRSIPEQIKLKKLGHNC